MKLHNLLLLNMKNLSIKLLDATPFVKGQQCLFDGGSSKLNNPTAGEIRRNIPKTNDDLVDGFVRLVGGKNTSPFTATT